MFDKHSKLLRKEKEKVYESQQKESNYRHQESLLNKEIKKISKEVYELEKKSVQSGIEVERMKERNQDVMQAI